MELLVVFILLGCALIYWYIDRKFKYWKIECPGVPFVKPEFFYGNSRGIGKYVSASELIQKIYSKLKPLGPVGGFYVFTQPSLMITNLDLVKRILGKDFNNFPNRGRYFNERDDPLSANLLNLEDNAWKNLRQKLTPTFTSGKIKAMFDLVSQKADKLVKTVASEAGESNSAVEVRIIFARYTTDVIASTAFGIECNTLEDGSNRFMEIGLEVMRPSNFWKRALVNKFKNLSRKLRIPSIPKEVSEFYLGVVQETIQWRKENPQDQRSDFLSLLMNLQDPSLSDPLTFHQVAAQCFIFFSAGKFNKTKIAKNWQTKMAK